VHNEHVVRRLEELGAVFVEDESEIPAGEFCVLSAHGVAPAVKQNAQARGLKIVDATCPLVNKVHAEARRYADSGHLVALVGHRDHVEEIGTKAFAERLTAWKTEGKVLVVLPARDPVVERSCRNLREVRVLLADSLNVVDLLEADTIVFTADALARAQEVYG